MLSKERVSTIGWLLRKIHVVSKWKSDNFSEANKLLPKGCFNFVVNKKLATIIVKSQIMAIIPYFLLLGPFFGSLDILKT